MWNYLYAFMVPVLALWALSALAVFKPLGAKKWAGIALLALGEAILLAFIILLWVTLERPPLRTLGETRLWYAFFLPLCALFVELKWKIRWIRVYSLIFAGLFVFLGLFSPETWDKTLMPALQSPWFVPHVIVYIVGYAFLGASALFGVYGYFRDRQGENTDETLRKADLLVVLGYVFLTLGLLFGGFWAKEAWGNYWTWDPKEIWAFITWLTYLLYLHFTRHGKPKNRNAFLILIAGFAVILVCWFGINYLVTAGQSVHTYTN